MAGHIEHDPLEWRLDSLGTVNNVLAKRVGEAVEEGALFLADILARMVAGLRDQVVSTPGDVIAWWLLEIEGQCLVVEPGSVTEHEASDRPETLADPVELSPGVGKL